VLDGGTPVDVDVGEDIAVEGDEEVVEEEEEVELVDTLLLVCVAESPPPTPPPIAAPNNTSAIANAIQNVRVARPQMRGDDLGGG